MAITLNSLKKVRAVDPPRVLIYGPAGIGKTTLASEFPAPIFWLSVFRGWNDLRNSSHADQPQRLKGVCRDSARTI